MKFPKYQTLLVTQKKGNLFITLNRPKARNAMNDAMVEELISVFDELHDDKEVRAVVIRGAEGNFCSGSDMKDITDVKKAAGEGEGDLFYQLNRKFGRMLMKVNASPQVVIAIIEGAALGGGLGLVCVSDVAIAKKDAQFGLPETTIGIPPAQIIPFLVGRIGLTQARRLALLGARFNSETALKLGLVHVLCDSDEKMELELKTTLVQVKLCAPGANAVAKEIMLAADTIPREKLLNDAAREFSACLQGPEGKEGTLAFKEKRLPYWAVTDKYIIIPDERPKLKE